MPQPRRTPSKVVPAGWGTAVALGASTALLLFSALTVASTYWTRRDGAATVLPARTPVAADVDVWVGDLAPGVKAVLSAEWNHPDWDRLQDERWNAGFGADVAPGLAFYALLAFNTSAAPVELAFPEGAFRIVAPPPAADAAVPPSGTPLATASLDLRAWLEKPGIATSAAATTLRMLGADRGAISIPPGKMLRRPLAFPRRIPLETAEAVVRSDGTAFHRRRMRRSEWAGLLASPSVEQIRAL
ncbi:MAG: hypothetical protein U1E39_11775 [Planctomycetota bacterium]